MNADQEASRDKASRDDESPVPANDGIDIPGKAQQPDEDRTVPGTMPTEDEAAEAPGEDTLNQEHHVGRNHAEPTEITGTTNDNAIDTEYIDVGGGD